MCGLFRSNLKRVTIQNDRKSHTRQCGDGSSRSKTMIIPHTTVWGWFRSSPKRVTIQNDGNPPHSVGMVQIQSTESHEASRVWKVAAGRRDLNNLHTAVWGWFRANLKRVTIQNDRKSPTRKCGDGSDPTYREPRSKTIGNPPHGSVGMVQIQPTESHEASRVWMVAAGRRDLNNPHTAVWGIHKSLGRSRLVGGI